MNDEGEIRKEHGAWGMGGCVKAWKGGVLEYWSTGVMEGGKIFLPGHNPDEPEYVFYP